MTEDILAQAARRAKDICPGKVGKYMSMLMGWAGQQRWPAVPRQIVDKLSRAVLALPVSAPDRNAVAKVVAAAIPADPDDGTTPVYWEHHDAKDSYVSPVWGSPLTVGEAVADALISAGLVRELPGVDDGQG